MLKTGLEICLFEVGKEATLPPDPKNFENAHLPVPTLDFNVLGVQGNGFGPQRFYVQVKIMFG